MHFVMQFTHVSRHFRVYKNDKKKHCLRKTALKMWSQICEKIAYVSTKLRLKKCAKTKKKRRRKKLKHLQSVADSGDKTISSRGFLRPHLQNSFP